MMKTTIIFTIINTVTFSVSALIFETCVFAFGRPA